MKPVIGEGWNGAIPYHDSVTENPTISVQVKVDTGGGGPVIVIVPVFGVIVP
jgi:hypothetical protein